MSPLEPVSCLQPSLSCEEEHKWLEQICLGLGQQTGTGFAPGWGLGASWLTLPAG